MPAEPSEKTEKKPARKKVEQAVSEQDKSEFAQLTKSAERGIVYVRNDAGDLEEV